MCCSQKYYHINIVLCTILLIEHLSLRHQGPQTGNGSSVLRARWRKDHKMKLGFSQVIKTDWIFNLPHLGGRTNETERKTARARAEHQIGTQCVGCVSHSKVCRLHYNIKITSTKNLPPSACKMYFLSIS